MNYLNYKRLDKLFDYFGILKKPQKIPSSLFFDLKLDN